MGADREAGRRLSGQPEHAENKTEAARLLRTDYKTLHVKMKRYGLSSRASPEH